MFPHKGVIFYTTGWVKSLRHTNASKTYANIHLYVGGGGDIV